MGAEYSDRRGHVVASERAACDTKRRSSPSRTGLHRSPALTRRRKWEPPAAQADISCVEYSCLVALSGAAEIDDYGRFQTQSESPTTR